MRKKSLALLLVLVMLLGLAAPSAMAAEQENPALTAEEPAHEEQTAETVLETCVPDGALPSNDELFAGYMQDLLYPGSRIMLMAAAGRDTLNDAQKAVYDTLKGKISDIANGYETNTKFQFSVSSSISSDELKEVLNALLYDCPYELYWFDKLSGWIYGGGSSITAYFYVADAYQDKTADGYTEVNFGDGKEQIPNAKFTTDREKTSAAAETKEKAQNIVDWYADLSDYEKLEAYKDEICALVSYNDEAADDDYTGGYGDPWQIIYVFDDNPSTNVVCEGYAKAFQYLCDLSGLTCYTVSGTMTGGTGAGGGHMWNIVTLDGANYLVDVTNSDSGSVGQNGGLFLNAPQSGTWNSTYTFSAGSQTITYTYDSNTLYGSSILTLADSDYTPPAKVTGLTATATYDGETNTTLYIDVPTKGNTVEVTLTATATYSDETPSETVDAVWEIEGNPWGVEISDNKLIIYPSASNPGQTAWVQVSASYGGQTAYVTLSLVKNSAIVTSFNISGPDSITIPNSGSNTAQYSIGNVYDQYGGTMSVPDNVQWSISGMEGVSVDKTTGVVTVTDKAASDTATLTATCGSVYKDFSIDIRSKENAEVTITGVPKDVVKGDSFQLNANVDGFDPDASRQWTSSNEDVLSIINSGTEGVFDDSIQAYVLLKAVGSGTAIITFTCEDDTRYGQDSVIITVLKKPTLGDFTYDLPKSVVYDGSAHPVTVSCDDEDMKYTVLYNGNETVPVNAGSYTVTLQVEKANGYAAAAFTLGSFTIAKATPTINVNSTLEVTKNTTQPLNAAISNNGTLTYKSSNTRVATVDENGNVTGVKEGTATITISYAGDSNYNRASETVTVTVTDKKLVDVTFTAKDNQTYKPEGYKLGAQFSEATVDGDKSITKYIYNGTEYGSLSALPTVTDAGTYTVTAVYESDTEYGEAKATFTIEPKDISTSGSVTLSSTSVTYTGTQAAVSVTSVVMDGHTLTASVDYTVSIPAAINAGTYTVTVTGQGNYTGTATADFTITKAEASAAMTTVSADARYGTAGTVALDLAGGTAGTIAVSDASNVLNGTPALSNGVLSFVFVDSEANVDKTATITIPVTGAPNYEDYTITVTVTVVDKFLPDLTVNAITTTYTGSPVSAGLIRGTATYEGKTVKGTWSWTGGNAPTTVAQSGSYSVTFTPEETDIYANATTTVTVTINKATPAGSPGYTAIKEPGKTLKDAALTMGSFKDGTIKWDDAETTVVQANVSYKWTFTPDDAANYNVVTGRLTPYRVSSDNDSGSSSSGVSKPSTSGGTTTVTTGVTPELSGTTASASVSSSDLNKAVESALETAKDKGTAPAVEIAISTPKRSDTLEVTLPANALEDLGSDREATLTITSGVADVTLDSDAITAVADQAGSKVTLTVAPVKNSDLNKLQREAVGDSPVLSLTLVSGSKVISDFRGGTATVTVSYDLPKGVDAEDVVVWFMDDYGNITPCDTTYNSRTGMLTFETKHFSLYVVGTKSAATTWPFTDVDESHWARTEIAWAYENGYMNGISATTFSPSGTVSRQQVWMILARMAGADPADMAEAKAWSVDSGISDGSNPGGAVSRQQLVSLLYRFAAQYGYDITAKADLSGYPDMAALASYATDAMAWSVANGIIGGTTQGTLNPAGTANRGQLAAILWRFYQTTAI